MNNKIDVNMINKEILKEEVENINFITNEINIIDLKSNKNFKVDKTKYMVKFNVNIDNIIRDLNANKDDSLNKQVIKANLDKTSFDYRKLYCKRKLNQTDFNSILRKKKLLSLRYEY